MGPNKQMKPFILEGKAKGRSGCSQDAGAVDLSGDLACDQISVKTATAETILPSIYSQITLCLQLICFLATDRNQERG